MCFFNCVVNGMLHAAAKMGNEAYKNKLNELFSMNGCKLRNPNGADVTYSYEQLPSWNGKFNILEQHVVNHIDNCNRNLPRNQKWEALSIMTTLKMLGLREQTEWNNPGNWNLPPEFQPAEVAAMSPKDKILAFLKDLQKGPEKNMLFAFVEQVPRLIPNLIHNVYQISSSFENALPSPFQPLESLKSFDGSLCQGLERGDVSAFDLHGAEALLAEPLEVF